MALLFIVLALPIVFVVLALFAAVVEALLVVAVRLDNTVEFDLVSFQAANLGEFFATGLTLVGFESVVSPHVGRERLLVVATQGALWTLVNSLLCLRLRTEK